MGSNVQAHLCPGTQSDGTRLAASGAPWPGQLHESSSSSRYLPLAIYRLLSLPDNLEAKPFIEPQQTSVRALQSHTSRSKKQSISFSHGNRNRDHVPAKRYVWWFRTPLDVSKSDRVSDAVLAWA